MVVITGSKVSFQENGEQSSFHSSSPFIIMENKEIEKKILKMLEKKKKSTSEISAIINRNYYYTLGALVDLEFQKKVKRIEEGKYTYWISINKKRSK